MKTGTGFTASYTYEDHRNVKTSVANSFGNTAVSTYTYEYDELGRRKSVKNTGSAFNNPIFNIYGYNDRSEVTASSSFTGEDLANKNNPLADRGRAYNYDPIGNRKTATEAANNLAYTSNSLNQYESISGGANPETPAYDLDGNMTVSKGMILSYNAENRLIEAAPQNPQQGSIKSTYIYDYLGRRARKTLYTYSSGSWQKQKEISFIYDGWNMVKEIEKASDSSPEVPTYYVWGLDLSQSMQGAGGVGGLIASVKSGNEYLYSYDANGNVGQMVKSTDGSIAARYEYDPFGKTLFAEGQMAGENPYRFSTKYQDVETGFYYYGYRYYDVEIGRWINRDPIGEDGGINIYVFVLNESIINNDILGLFTLRYAINSLRNKKVTPQQVSPNPRGLPSYSDTQIFEEWLSLEKANMDWLKELTPCPKKLECVDKEKKTAKNPNPEIWKNPTSANPEHTGAVFEMRSVPTKSGHANQCCYDEKGDIMRNIPAGGTADYVSHGFNTGHFLHDLDTWWLAKKLNRKADYYYVRPVIVEQ